MANLRRIWGASSGMAMTISALDKCYDVEESRPYWKLRPLAIVLTIIDASLILAVIVLLPVATVALNWVKTHATDILSPQAAERVVSFPLLVMFNISRYGTALAFMFLALATLYHFGPNIRQRLRWITPGSLFCESAGGWNGPSSTGTRRPAISISRSAPSRWTSGRSFG